MKLLGKTVLLTNFQSYSKPKTSGILLPDSAGEKVGQLVQGTVVEVGTGVKDSDIVEGDDVLVPNHFGTIININDKLHKIYNYEDVAAIID